MNNSTVVVTGAAKGIGLACVKAFLAEGSKVVANYRSEIGELGSIVSDKLLTVQGDMSQEADIAHVFAEANMKFGTVNILVNNAGIVGRTKFPELSGEDFLEMLRVNTVGPYLVSQQFANQTDTGAIVNIGSMRAFVPTSIDYSASKAALQNMTVSLAKAVGPSIRVNAVAPGFTKTDMHTGNLERLEKEAEKSVLKRYSEASDIADAVVFFASKKAQSITGQVLLVDNGRSLV